MSTTASPDFWTGLRNDERLARARQRLSMDELRMIYQHAIGSLTATEPPLTDIQRSVLDGTFGVRSATDERREGHSKLVYDKEKRTIVTVDPHRAASPSPAFPAVAGLIERLEAIGKTRQQATPVDLPANYMTVYARLSREDGALMCEAAAALSRLQARKDEWFNRACALDAQLQLQTARAEALAASAATMREALIDCQRVLALLADRHAAVSAPNVVSIWAQTVAAEAKARAALGGQHG